MAPLVSIIVPAYNHAGFVVECLRSVDEQTYRPIELIVIDDGSTDGTGRVVQATMAELSIPVVFRRTENSGLCRTLNRALALAQGVYVGVLASDDAIEPEKIAKQVDYLEATGQGVAGCYGDMVAMDVFGQRHEVVSYAPPPAGDPFLQFVEGTRWLSLQNGLFRKAAVETVGAFDDSLFFEDADFLLRLLLRFDYDYVPGVVTRYRRVPGAMNVQVRHHASDILRMYRKHIDHPRLRALGFMPQRRYMAHVWWRIALLHFAHNDMRRARRGCLAALRMWPAHRKAWIYLGASFVGISWWRRVLELRGTLGRGCSR